MTLKVVAVLLAKVRLKRVTSAAEKSDDLTVSNHHENLTYNNNEHSLRKVINDNQQLLAISAHHLQFAA